MGHNGAYSFEEKHSWIPSLGASYHVALDGLSAPMFFLTTLIFPLVVIFSWDLEKRGNLLQGEHLAARSGQSGDLDPANGKRLCSREPVSEELTDQGLFTTSGRFGQAVEGRRLVVRQPHE